MDQVDPIAPGTVASDLPVIEALPLEDRVEAYLQQHRRLQQRLGVPGA